MLRAEEIADEEVLLQVTTESGLPSQAPHLRSKGSDAASNITACGKKGRRAAGRATEQAPSVPGTEGVDDELEVAVEGCGAEGHGLQSEYVEVEVEPEGYEDMAVDQGDYQQWHPETRARRTHG